MMPTGSNRDSQSPQTIREQARAKVNLTLHIKGKRVDGYHELESLVVFAGLCDELAFTPATKDTLEITGPFAEAVDGENLVLKAKHAVASLLKAEINGHFYLQKNIPVAAGLGGGSSDAAAAIRALLVFSGREIEPDELTAMAAKIGADVPVCLRQSAAWMGGLGERVAPAARLSALPAILVNPRLKLSTAAVFKTLNAPPFNPDRESDSFSMIAEWCSPESAVAFLKTGRNDLEAPAIALEPAVRNVLDLLSDLDGCLLARLSGSGPTCFGLFPSQDAAKNAAETIAQARPDWWVAATTLS